MSPKEGLLLLLKRSLKLTGCKLKTHLLHRLETTPQAISELNKFYEGDIKVTFGLCSS